MSKKNFLNPFLLTGALVASLGAGLSQAQTYADIPVKLHTDNRLADTIITDITLTKDKIWILKGYTLVKSGVTLTIEAGTTIQGDAATKGTLMVDRGGKLIAAGTAAEPITFRGEIGADRGTWGGIVLLGKAIVNQGTQNLYEALGWAKYGGTQDNDNSGVLTYVRLDGPGFPVVVDRELNGLTLCGVGNQTVIHHIHVHRGDDDGIEWFGGSVNSSHLVVTNETDDAFDIDLGYTGTSQYMIGIQRVEEPRVRPPGSTVPFEPVGDNVIECSSTQGGNLPLSNLNWSNLTMIDNGGAGGVLDAKEECAGVWKKAVFIAGGINDSASVWAVRVQGDAVVANLTAVPARITFEDVFITGKWKNLIDVSALGARGPDSLVQVAQIKEIFAKVYKTIPYATAGTYGLNKDLSPSHPDIIAAKAGAIVDGDLWYQGWTFPGALDFPLGDTPVAPNTSAPTVTLVSDPVTLPYAPATFTLVATATDPDGISLLEILKDGSVLNSSSTGSVSFSVPAAAAGVYTYTARATDNHVNNKKTATQDLMIGVLNKPNAAAPVVTFTHNGGTTVWAPATFKLIAGATDADGIASLEILKGGDVIASNAGSTSLELTQTGLAAGSHLYTVRAKDVHGTDQKTTTQDLLVEIKENQPPKVTLSNTGENLTSPASFTLNATASDTDGAIASLEIFEGNELLGSVTTNTLAVPLSGKAKGEYTYTVKATDNNPVNPKTATFEWKVNVFDPSTAINGAAPLVTLIRGDDKALIAPASFKLVATAGDGDGIDTLEVLLDGVVVATGTSITLEVPVANKAAGSYTYTARAKDKHPTDPKTATKELKVDVAAPAPNVAPTLKFSRTGADTLRALADFSLFAEATDPDSNGIAIVEILLNGTVIGTSTTNALLIQVEDKTPGTYTYTARAKDKHATEAIEITKTLVVIVGEPAVALAKPLRDLEGIRISASRGQDLVLESAGYGSIKVAVWSLAGKRVAMRDVNLVQGQNAVRMGNLRGVHIVRLSNGPKARSARVVFNPGK